MLLKARGERAEGHRSMCQRKAATVNHAGASHKADGDIALEMPLYLAYHAPKHAGEVQTPEEDFRMGSVDLPWEPQASGPLTSSPETNNLGSPAPPQSPQELEEERRKIRRLQMVVNMVSQVIAQDSGLTIEEASEMVADTRRVALGMFPDKEIAFNLIYWPRLQRLMRERYRMQ